MPNHLEIHIKSRTTTRRKRLFLVDNSKFVQLSLFLIWSFFWKSKCRKRRRTLLILKMSLRHIISCQKKATDEISIAKRGFRIAIFRGVCLRFLCPILCHIRLAEIHNNISWIFCQNLEPVKGVEKAPDACSLRDHHTGHAMKNWLFLIVRNDPHVKAELTVTLNRAK